jgi:hypothetical protein
MNGRSSMQGGKRITFVRKGFSYKTFSVCNDAISMLFSPSVHFGVHWVVECAGENQAILPK